jgi:cytochrome b561
LQLASLQSRGIHWWIGIAFVAGFGTQDITGRLRQISKALFGVAEGNDTKVGKGTGT